MPTGSWFNSHKKQVITHTSIVVVFVLFTIFVAAPLFGRFEQIAGESRRQDVSLPAATNSIQYWVDQFHVTTNTLEMNGWAFIEGQDSENSEVYIVLKSARRTYIFDTMVQERPDVTTHFEETGLNLDYSGFAALIPARKIANGEYTLGIYITKGDIEALQYTDITVEF